MAQSVPGATLIHVQLGLGCRWSFRRRDYGNLGVNEKTTCELKWKNKASVKFGCGVARGKVVGYEKFQESKKVCRW